LRSSASPSKRWRRTARLTGVGQPVSSSRARANLDGVARQRPDAGRHVNAIDRRRLVAFAALAALSLTAGAGLYYFYRPAPPVQPVKSLAVLPLRPLDAGENYLGLGIADAVIRRISQTGGLTVRPTSAVRRYIDEGARIGLRVIRATFRAIRNDD
jgi:hypothetical protein